MPISKALLLVAVILFLFAALGEHPKVLEDFELVPAGLAFAAASMVVEK
jgi:hypothetical protein